MSHKLVLILTLWKISLKAFFDKVSSLQPLTLQKNKIIDSYFIAGVKEFCHKSCFVSYFDNKINPDSFELITGCN